MEEESAPASDGGVPFAASPSPAGGPVPSPLGRKILLFLGIVLVEYWLAPLFFGVTNYAGLYSDAGTLLFFLFVGSLALFLVYPLWPHLRLALARGVNRWVFHGTWIGSFVVGLFAVNIIQFTGGPLSPGVQLGASTVYSPFGSWPTLTIYVPALHLWSAWNVEGPTILLLLSWLAASSIILGVSRVAPACRVPQGVLPALRRRWTSFGVLAPLGFISGCPGCAPVYFALLAVFAPGVAERASASVPLVPWIGFAGLLYLAGFSLSAWLVHRVTQPTPTVGGPERRTGAPNES